MIRFTAHALEALQRRAIDVEWVEQTLRDPQRRETDPTDLGVMRSFRAFSEADGRVLRVVHRSEQEDVVVITAFFDRGAKS